MSDVSSIHRGRMFSCVFRQVFWCHELDLDIKLFFGFWVRRGPMHTNQDLRLNSNFNQPSGFFVDVRISLMLCMTIWRSETCSFKTPASWCMFGVGKDILRLWLHASCSWGLVGWFKSWPKGKKFNYMSDCTLNAISWPPFKLSHFFSKRSHVR